MPRKLFAAERAEEPTRWFLLHHHRKGGCVTFALARASLLYLKKKGGASWFAYPLGPRAVILYAYHCSCLLLYCMCNSSVDRRFNP